MLENTETSNGINHSEDTDKEYCRILYDILIAKGVKDIVLSPGSRNAPLLLGACCRQFNHHVIIDERTAAFVALGMALGSNRPVAICCTSGTALYNYAPAVAEAFYQQIPLIVVSADRPLEWIDQDDSQTLVQSGALSKIVKGSYDIPVQHKDDINEKWYVNRIINEACNLALSGRRGPVHINIRLDNPLTDTCPYTPGNPRIIEYIDNLNFQSGQYKEFASSLTGKKILLTAGFMQPDNERNKSVLNFASLPCVAVMSETLSNLHLPDNPYSIDIVLTWLEKYADSDTIEQLRPDVVISIGGALVSRKLKEFLRKYPPTEHWTLGDTNPSADCFKALTKHINIDPAKFLKGLNQHKSRLCNVESTDISRQYARIWKECREKALIDRDEYLSEHSEWSEISAFRHILNELPTSFNLFLSNGTAVRYGQLFTQNIPHAVFGCRGVSGIDGTSATAVGCAMAYQGPTLLLTGDMSMAYGVDILSLNNIPRNFKIIVINNSGGGIFRFIPSTRECPVREELFCAAPNLPLRGLAEAYGWKYFRAHSMEELEAIYLPFLTLKQKSILEIKADDNISANVLIGLLENRINRK